MTEDLKQSLIDKAGEKFGNTRAEELKPDLEKLTADLEAIRGYPLTIENEF